MDPLTRWNHLRWCQLNAPEDLLHTLGSLFSRSQVHWAPSPERVVHWVPLVHVSEDVNGYLVKAELPQVKKEGVKITLENGRLTITGEREFDRNSKKDHPQPLAYGRFAHSFVIPNDARPARVTSVFKEGVLIVHLTRNAKAATQQLEGKVFSTSSLGVGIEEAT